MGTDQPVALPPYRPNLDDFAWENPGALVKRDGVWHGAGPVPELPRQTLPKDIPPPAEREVFVEPNPSADDIADITLREGTVADDMIPVSPDFADIDHIRLQKGLDTVDSSKFPEDVLYKDEDAYIYKPIKPEVPMLPPATGGEKLPMVIDAKGLKLEKVAKKFAKEDHNRKARVLRKYLATSGLEDIYQTPFFNKRTGEIYDPKVLEVKALDLAEQLSKEVPLPHRVDNVVSRAEVIKRAELADFFSDSVSKMAKTDLENIVDQHNVSLLEIMHKRGFIAKTLKSTKKDFGAYPVNPKELIQEEIVEQSSKYLPPQQVQPPIAEPVKPAVPEPIVPEPVKPATSKTGEPQFPSKEWYEKVMQEQSDISDSYYRKTEEAKKKIINNPVHIKALEDNDPIKIANFTAEVGKLEDKMEKAMRKEIDKMLKKKYPEFLKHPTRPGYIDDYADPKTLTTDQIASKLDEFSAWRREKTPWIRWAEARLKKEYKTRTQIAKPTTPISKMSAKDIKNEMDQLSSLPNLTKAQKTHLNQLGKEMTKRVLKDEPTGLGFREVYTKPLSEVEKGKVLEGFLNPVGDLSQKGFPLLPMPEIDSEEDGIRKYKINWIINPRFFPLYKTSPDAFLRKAVAQQGGEISGKNLKEIAEKIKNVFRNPTKIDLPNKKKIPQPKPEVVNKLFSRKFKRIAKREGIFQNADVPRLASTFIALTKNLDINPVAFDYEAFVYASKVSGLTDQPETALYNYLQSVRPVTGQPPAPVLTPRPTSLTRKGILERNISERVKESQDIGLQRSEILNNRVASHIEGLDEVVKSLQMKYHITPELKRIGLKWNSINPNATLLPKRYEQQILGMLDQIKEDVQFMQAGEDMAHKLISANGVELASLNPKATAIASAQVGDKVNNTAYMLDVIQGQKLPFQKAVTLFNNRDKIQKAFKVEVDPIDGTAKLMPNPKFTWKTIPNTVTDTIFENLISQASTYNVVNLSALTAVMGRFIDNAFIDLIRTSRKVLGKVTRDDWAKFQSPESLLQKRFVSNMAALKPALRDWADVITSVKDANLLLTNQQGGTFQMDIFRGMGVAERSANQLKNWRDAGGEMRKWAVLPEYALRILNGTWGVGKLKATDAFVKRMQYPIELYNQVETEVINTIRTSRKETPPTIDELKRMVQERHAEAILNYQNRLPDPAVTLMLDELNAQLFRNKKAGIMGGQSNNMGTLFRGMRKILNSHVGPVGRFVSMFTEVAINSADYMIQRMPGLQFANPHIRRQWNELGQSDEVIAKALTGLTISFLGAYLHLKNKGRIKVTDSMEDKFAFREIYGYFPPADVSFQSAIIEDGDGRFYKLDPTLPLAQHLNFSIVLMNYLDDFKKTGDTAKLVNDSLLNMVKKMTPWSIVDQYSSAIKALYSWGEDKGGDIVSGTGSFTQRLLEIGLFKETKDFVRGFSVPSNVRKGVLKEDLSGIRELTPLISLPRVASTQLPLVDYDRVTPQVAWDGFSLEHRDPSAGALSNIRDYFHFVQRNKKAHNTQINEVLWEIESEDGNSPLKLLPTKNFSLKDIYISQMQGIDKASIMKGILSENIHKQNVKMQWRLNNYHQNQITALSAGKMINTDIIQNGKRTKVSIDFNRELNALQDIDFSADWLSISNYNYFKKNLNHLRTYGNDKVKAVKKVIGENLFSSIRDSIHKEVSQNPPIGYSQLNAVITKHMRKSFFNVNSGDVLLNTPEALFTYNRLKVHFDNGQFDGFRDRRKKSYEEMRTAINKVVTPYNELAKTIYISKVIAQDDTFISKVVAPLEQQHQAEILSGPYNLPAQGKMDQVISQ